MLLRFLLILGILGCRVAVAGDFYPVDGDSLEHDGVRIRLNGIDAPEITQTCYLANGQEYACGEAALQHLQSLLKRGNIRCDCLDEKDIYKRSICECFAGDISLNKAMVMAGLAMTYRSEKYAKDEQAAKHNKRGIWRGKFMRPALYRALERVRNPVDSL